MKLYVWANPYHVPYGTSMLLVVARSVSAATKLANAKAKAYHYADCEQIDFPNMVLGPPTRIVDLPCAEWHEWSE